MTKRLSTGEDDAEFIELSQKAFNAITQKAMEEDLTLGDATIRYLSANLGSDE